MIKVVDAIGSIDDLIEKLSQQNKLLEYLSWLLVKEAEGDTPPDSILKNHISIETGSMNVEDNDEHGIYPFFTRNEGIFRANRYTHEGEGAIVAGEGNFMPKYASGRFALHQRAYFISSTDSAISNATLFHLIKDAVPYLSATAVGSTVKSLRRFSFETIPFKSRADYRSVYQTSDSIRKAIMANQKIIESLSSKKVLLLAKYF